MPATTNDHLLAFGTAVRTMDDSGRVGGYLVRFGGPEEKDLYDTYFPADCYYGARAGDGSDCLFNHGIPLRSDVAHLADILLPAIRTTRDDIGIWAEVVLDLADEYQKAIHDLTTRGVLAWSSGSAPHMVKIDDDGRVRRWPIVEGSLTPTPGTPHGRTAIVPLRSLLSTEQEQEGTDNDMTTELDSRLGRIEEQLELFTRGLPSVQRDARFVPGDTASDDQAARQEDAFRSYTLSGDSRSLRALNTGTIEAGGALVPQKYSQQIITRLYQDSVMRQAGARQMTVEGTDSYEMPDMTYGEAAQLTREGQDYHETEPTFGALKWHPYKFTRLTKATEEQIEDARLDIIQEVLAPDAAYSFASAENSYFTTGTGASEPQGVLTAAPVGKTAASATVIEADEIIDTYHSLNHLYRSGAVWMMNDSTAAYLRKMKDATANYLWESNLQAGVPGSLLGKPVIINDALDDIGTGAKPILFGNFRYFVVIDFGGGSMYMKRLDQLFAMSGLVGFVWRKRFDSRVVLPEAFSVLQMA
jgi:HK97 family phage major capsid protein